MENTIEAMGVDRFMRHNLGNACQIILGVAYQSCSPDAEDMLDKAVARIMWANQEREKHNKKPLQP